MLLKPKGYLILLLLLQTALSYAQLQAKFPNGMPAANASCFDVFSATPVSRVMTYQEDLNSLNTRGWKGYRLLIVIFFFWSFRIYIGEYASSRLCPGPRP